MRHGFHSICSNIFLVSFYLVILKEWSWQEANKNADICFGIFFLPQPFAVSTRRGQGKLFEIVEVDWLQKSSNINLTFHILNRQWTHQKDNNCFKCQIVQLFVYTVRILWQTKSDWIYFSKERATHNFNIFLFMIVV